MSMVGHDSTEKSIVSFVSKITVCWHFTAAVFKSLTSAVTIRANTAYHGRWQSTQRITMVMRSRSIAAVSSAKLTIRFPFVAGWRSAAVMVYDAGPRPQP